MKATILSAMLFLFSMTSLARPAYDGPQGGPAYAGPRIATGEADAVDVTCGSGLTMRLHRLKISSVRIGSNDVLVTQGVVEQTGQTVTVEEVIRGQGTCSVRAAH